MWSTFISSAQILLYVYRVNSKMKAFISFFIVLSFNSALVAQEKPLQIALLKYNGGGDWYANPNSLPNLIKYCNQTMRMNIEPEPGTVEVGSAALFNYPFVHITGHGNVVFSNQELENLRTYLLAGGFLHADDNYGMDKFIRIQLEKLFPGDKYNWNCHLRTLSFINNLNSRRIA